MARAAATCEKSAWRLATRAAMFMTAKSIDARTIHPAARTLGLDRSKAPSFQDARVETDMPR